MYVCMFCMYIVLDLKNKVRVRINLAGPRIPYKWDGVWHQANHQQAFGMFASFHEALKIQVTQTVTQTTGQKANQESSKTSVLLPRGGLPVQDYIIEL